MYRELMHERGWMREYLAFLLRLEVSSKELCTCSRIQNVIIKVELFLGLCHLLPCRALVAGFVVVT